MKIIIIIFAGVCLAALVYILLVSSRNGHPVIGTTAQPLLPVSVSWNRAIFGNSFVLVMQNTSNDALPVKVDCVSPTFGEKMFRMVLRPRDFTKFGKLEGWDFVTGDAVTLSSAGYVPIQRKAND